jgi:hypothetical protein
VKHSFPHFLRLSIHQSTGEHKISVSLLNTKTGFTTPWHCSVALMADGEWVSAPMRDFQNDPNMKLVYEDGRPSYFQETSNGGSSTDISSTQATPLIASSTQSLKDGSKVVSDATSPSLEEIEEVRLHDIARKLSKSGSDSEIGASANPFFSSDNPELNPQSSTFSVAKWLQAIMNITLRDPDRYPKGVAGVAYRDLSAYGKGEATDFQHTFGNYPLKLFKSVRGLLVSKKESRVQILRGLDGLVKSGEMLVVLGRPGR